MFQTVIAAHREIETLGERVRSALDFSYTPPVDVDRISVLLVAGHFAALAADAFGHVEVEAVLFPGFEGPLRDERRVGLHPACRPGRGAHVVQVVVRIVGCCSFE